MQGWPAGSFQDPSWVFRPPSARGRDQFPVLTDRGTAPPVQPTPLLAAYLRLVRPWFAFSRRGLSSGSGEIRSDSGAKLASCGHRFLGRVDAVASGLPEAGPGSKRGQAGRRGVCRRQRSVVFARGARGSGPGGFKIWPVAGDVPRFGAALRCWGRNQELNGFSPIGPQWTCPGPGSQPARQCLRVLS